MRLRSSVRGATSVIVASGCRAVRRRRNRGRRGASLTVVLPGPGGSAGAVGRAALLGAGPEFGGARLGEASLLVQPGGQVTVGRGSGGDDLTADRRRLGGVPATEVVVLHALHLALEDPQRAAERAGGIRKLLVAEEQQDRQDDQDDLGRAKVHRVLLGSVTAGMLRRGRTRAGRSAGVRPVAGLGRA